MFDGSRAFFHEYYDEVERRAEEERQNTLKDPLPYQNQSKYNGTVLDLREYGFDREISTLELFKNKSLFLTLYSKIRKV